MRHLGPMAQDFMVAFGLGDDDRKINFLDANGVVMVAIQALYRRVVRLESQVSERRPDADSAGPEEAINPAVASLS